MPLSSCGTNGLPAVSLCPLACRESNMSRRSGQPANRPAFLGGEKEGVDLNGAGRLHHLDSWVGQLGDLPRDLQKMRLFLHCRFFFFFADLKGNQRTSWVVYASIHRASSIPRGARISWSTEDCQSVRGNPLEAWMVLFMIIPRGCLSYSICVSRSP